MPELFIGQIEKIGDVTVRGYVTWLKGRFGSRNTASIGKWADLLADVSAVDAVSGLCDGGAELFGDGTFEFDGEVGEAAAGVEAVGFEDRAGRAGVEAAAAGPAAAEGRGVLVEGHVVERFAEIDQGRD